MNIPAVKRLVENYTPDQLQEAEVMILEEKQTVIPVEGIDEGEKLTHVMAALDILRDMQQNNLSLAQAVRNFTARVRRSID